MVSRTVFGQLIALVLIQGQINRQRRVWNTRSLKG